MRTRKDFIRSVASHNKGTILGYRATRFRRHMPRQDDRIPLDNLISEDAAVSKYFGIIQSLPKNDGILPRRNHDSTCAALREFLLFLGKPITNHAVTELIDEVKKAHNSDNFMTENKLETFSNTQNILVHRNQATRVKAVFKANKVPLVLSINTHSEGELIEIDEGALRRLFADLGDEEQTMMEFQAYSGETVGCICSRVTTQQIELIDDDYAVIHVEKLQTRVRYSHPSIVPRRVAEKVIEIAKVTHRDNPFPNHETIWKNITQTASRDYAMTLRSYHLRRRFAAIARKTDMEEEDWRVLMGAGSKPKESYDIRIEASCFGSSKNRTDT